MSRKRPPNVSGVILVDKPPGVTSHDVVQGVRRVFQQSQVGHTGTLDPAATGLLVLTLGRATRLGRYIEAESKTYQGVMMLGQRRTTWDEEGEVEAEAPVPELSEEAVGRVFAGMVGPLDHAVPAFSAVKLNGERLHAKARRGESFELPRRRIEVHRLALTSFQPPRLGFEAEVSKGTYIRSLAVELGQRLGTLAYLKTLRRTRVGCHWVQDAYALPELSHTSRVTPPAEALSQLPVVVVSGPEAVSVAHGRGISGPEEAHPGPIRILDRRGRLLAVARTTESGQLAYDVVLVRPEELASG